MPGARGDRLEVEADGRACLVFTGREERDGGHNRDAVPASRCSGGHQLRRAQKPRPSGVSVMTCGFAPLRSHWCRTATLLLHCPSSPAAVTGRHLRSATRGAAAAAERGSAGRSAAVECVRDVLQPARGGGRRAAASPPMSRAGDGLRNRLGPSWRYRPCVWVAFGTTLTDVLPLGVTPCACRP